MSKSEHVLQHVFFFFFTQKEANLTCLLIPSDKAVCQEATSFFFLKKKQLFLSCSTCWLNKPCMQTSDSSLHANKEGMFLSRAAVMQRHCDLGQWAKQPHRHRRLPLPRLHTGYEQFPPSSQSPCQTFPEIISSR